MGIGYLLLVPLAELSDPLYIVTSIIMLAAFINTLQVPYELAIAMFIRDDRSKAAKS